MCNKVGANVSGIVCLFACLLLYDHKIAAATPSIVSIFREGGRGKEKDCLLRLPLSKKKIFFLKNSLSNRLPRRSY